MGVAERIKAWRHALGLTQEQFAVRSGLPKRTLVGYENAEREPGSASLAAIAKTGVNMTWLLTGEGQMLARPAPEPVSDQALAPDSQLARRLAKIGELLDAMPAQESAALLEEFLSRATTVSELAELKRAVAELTASNQRHRKTG
jgi:transcriptional regulator with XRE-family HTH domain